MRNKDEFSIFLTLIPVKFIKTWLQAAQPHFKTLPTPMGVLFQGGFLRTLVRAAVGDAKGALPLTRRAEEGIEPLAWRWRLWIDPSESTKTILGDDRWPRGGWWILLSPIGPMMKPLQF